MPPPLFTFFEFGIQFRLICRKERKEKDIFCLRKEGEGGQSANAD
jgi:hypothetical protein